MASFLFRRLRAHSFTSAALFLAVALLATGCHPRVKDPKDPKFIVAEKGTWTITRGDLDKEINSYLAQRKMTLDKVPPAVVPQLETFMLDNMVLKKLMLDKAAAMQLKDVDKDEAAQLESIKSRIPPGTDLVVELKSVGMTLP